MAMLRFVSAASVLAGLTLAVPAFAHEVKKAPPAGATEVVASAESDGSAFNMVAVGQNRIGNRGFNADVWVHEQHAYVGSWGFQDWAQGSKTRFCPPPEKSGVAVIDATDPTQPEVVSRLMNPAGTSAEDVVVYTAQYGPMAGRDIAVVGIQTCGASRYERSLFRGLQVFDVTNPSAPFEVGRLYTGCCTRGLHELEVQNRGDLSRTYVYASVPASEYSDPLSPSGRRDEAGRGDFRLIDVTDPTTPVEVSNWGVYHDLGAPPGVGLGCDPDIEYGHSAEPRADGRVAFLSYWDNGFIAVDVSNPADPNFLGRTVYPSNADGDAHSSSFDESRGLLFAADEDFCKTSGPATEKGFGYLRVYDYNDLSAPVQIGTFKTPNSQDSTDKSAGDYTIHNALVEGTDVYISWYSDGIRVVDSTNPAAPVEVAHFVPPSANNPFSPSQRGVLTNTTQVWGVAYEAERDLVYASDMNSGLWILERTDR
jgi:hypothetical protein